MAKRLLIIALAVHTFSVSQLVSGEYAGSSPHADTSIFASMDSVFNRVKNYIFPTVSHSVEKSAPFVKKGVASSFNNKGMVATVGWDDCADVIVSGFVPTVPKGEGYDVRKLCVGGTIATAFDAHPDKRIPIFSMYRMRYSDIMGCGSRVDDADPDEVAPFDCNCTCPQNNNFVGALKARGTLKHDNPRSKSDAQNSCRGDASGKRPNSFSQVSVVGEGGFEKLQPTAKDTPYGPVWTRGHLAPFSIMKLVSKDMAVSMQMTNIAPQIAWFNNILWERLESRFRRWVQWRSPKLSKDSDVYFITGVRYDPSEASPKQRENAVPTPQYYWVVVCDVATGQSAGFYGRNDELDPRTVGEYPTFHEFVTVQEVETGVYGQGVGSLFPSEQCNTASVDNRYWWSTPVVRCKGGRVENSNKNGDL